MIRIYTDIICVELIKLLKIISSLVKLKIAYIYLNIKPL